MYTVRLARWLQTQGHDVEVIALEAIDAGTPSHIDAVHDVYQGLPVWRLSFNLVEAPQRRLWEFDNELLGEWFEDYFRRQRPDIAHFQAGYLLGVAPIFAADRQQIPIVLTLHDYWYLCPQHTLQHSDGTLCATVPENPLTCARCRLWGHDPYDRLGRWAGPSLRLLMEKLPLQVDATLMTLRRQRLQAALARVAMLIAPSQFMFSQFEQRVDPAKIVFCRTGYDGDHLRAGQQRAAGEIVRFGYIGQIAPHKGVHLLVEAFKHLDTSRQAAELHIWGGLEVNPAYSQKLREASLRDRRITLHGRFPSSELPDVLATFDYAIVPSTWFENCPLSILESHAAGIPVLTSKLGGMAELVSHEQDGLLFAPGDAADIARSMQRILDDRHLADHLRQGARQRKVRSVSAEMEQLLSIYTSVLSPILQPSGKC